MGTSTLLYIFFRVIYGLRYSSTFYCNHVALKQALKERYTTHQQLRFALALWQRAARAFPTRGCCDALARSCTSTGYLGINQP